jgi:serine/threonine protein kinase
MMDEGKQENNVHWRLMEEIFHMALPLVTTERHAFVAQHCAGDAALYEDANSLLAADDIATDFLREPVVELGLAVLADDSLRETEIMSQPGLPAAPDLVGTKVGGRYEITRRLGSGGFGEVYKAVDTKLLSKPVVIKVLKEAVLRTEGEKRDWVIKKFQQEIEALSKIQDAGVVGVFDADTLPDGRPCIVMEFVEGSDLRQFIQDIRKDQITEQGLELEDVAEILKQVGRTLTAAHEKEIIHRDLKPENIMLRRNASGDLQVKVIDFGIAKVRNSLIAPSTTTGLIVGTGYYMAPEQVRGKKVGPACDIYTLGVIAYELLTGRYPFPAKDREQLKEMQAAGVKLKPCDLNAELPAAAQETILKALSYYPAERHKRARDFGNELAAALIAGEELTPPARPSWFHSHQRWLLTGAMVLLLGLAGLAVWRAVKSPEIQPSPPARTPDAILETERTLTYWLHVRMPKDDGAQTFDEFDSTGEEAFKIGSKIGFRAHPNQAGFLYVINEGPGENGTRKWTAVFPNLRDNKESARLTAAQTMIVSETSLDRNPGNETLHIVWAESAVPELEALFRGAINARNAIFRDSAQQDALDKFFRQHPATAGEVFDDSTPPHLILKGRGEILVGSLNLKHRKYGN